MAVDSAKQSGVYTAKRADAQRIVTAISVADGKHVDRRGVERERVGAAAGVMESRLMPLYAIVLGPPKFTLRVSWVELI